MLINLVVRKKVGGSVADEAKSDWKKVLVGTRSPAAAVVTNSKESPHQGTFLRMSFYWNHHHYYQSDFQHPVGWHHLRCARLKNPSSAPWCCRISTEDSLKSSYTWPQSIRRKRERRRRKKDRRSGNIWSCCSHRPIASSREGTGRQIIRCCVLSDGAPPSFSGRASLVLIHRQILAQHGHVLYEIGDIISSRDKRLWSYCTTTTTIEIIQLAVWRKKEKRFLRRPISIGSTTFRVGTFWVSHLLSWRIYKGVNCPATWVNNTQETVYPEA